MATGFQDSEWEGRVGDIWADEWRRTDRSFAGLSPHLNAAILTAARGRRAAIDLGCGAGDTAIALATARPDMAITGIDLSPSLVSVATRRGSGLANLAFRVGDTSALNSGGSADLFLSRHGVMFFNDPVAAFTAIRRAGAPGVALVFSCFSARSDNQWAQVVDTAVGGETAAPDSYAPGPFALADPGFTATVLVRAGWHDAVPSLAAFDYVAGVGPDPVADAVDYFRRIGPAARVIASAEPDRRGDLVKRLATALAAHHTGGKVHMRAAAWIWTAHAGEAA